MKFSVQGRSEGKQHYQISFGVPLKLLKPFAWIGYKWRKFKFWLNPFRCECCGKRMYVRNPMFELMFPKGRLLVENFRPVCRECLVKELETKEWTPRWTHGAKEHGHNPRYGYRFWSEKQCAVTGNKVRSYKCVEIWPHVDMTFCTIAWNHDYISKEAVIKCVREGDVKTSTFGIHNKQMAQMNSKRLFINEKGELL